MVRGRRSLPPGGEDLRIAVALVEPEDETAAAARQRQLPVAVELVAVVEGAISDRLVLFRLGPGRPRGQLPVVELEAPAGR
jgi:hypothetical protein